MTVQPPPSIKLVCIDRSFASGALTARVLKGISLEIRAARMTLVVGPSGSGKSTLLAIASGLLRASGGSAVALGIDLSELDDRALDRFRLTHCGFVFQGFNLFASLTALEQVAYPLQYTPRLGADAKRRAADALETVGLGGKTHLRPQELSGGEKQRVALARAIAKDPELLFADEPTSALDRDNGARVAALLHSIARDQGATVLCVSHDQRLIDHADRVIQIEDGLITADDERTPKAALATRASS
jgi:putative ABC transport system ATP-binding protein